MFYLICYDVTCDRRRNRVARLLKGFGMRVQKSVFECVLSPEQFEMVCRKLEGYLEIEEDQVRFYLMSASTRRKVAIVGLQPERQVDDVAFIV